MTAGPLVSIVTASYNAARYLPISVRSALAQTYSPIELHVIDDGSTDDTQRVLEEFRHDSRVTIHVRANGGQASAKNLGIRASRGELVAFLDADDCWNPDKLEREVPLLLANSRAGVIYSDVSCMNEDGDPIPAPPRQYYDGAITAPLFVDNFVNFNTVVVKRECFERMGVFDESLSMGIDWDLWLRISTEYQFIYLNERTMSYRIWPGQMSKHSDKRFECTLRIMRRFLERYPSSVPEDTVSQAWAHTYANRARTLASSGRKREALRCLVAAIRIRPAYAHAWRGLARLALR